MSLSTRLCLAIILANLLVAGCASPPLGSASAASSAAYWHGRLAIRVESNQVQVPALSFAAGFELVGNPQAGELTLFAPFGTTLMSLSWSAGSAVVRHGGDTQHFDSLDSLVKHALGTEVPLTALFAWLAGDNVTAAGWSADLSNHAKGKILAHRLHPTPAAQISLLLEK
jgi:outer membrane lipoprotein LolB